MDDCVAFWKLEHLSHRQLLDGLQRVLNTQRCSLAELVAHLGEVEERRLHLEAAYRSLFAYCVQHLGMSEDEACRRIDLARLARRFPALFPELASGRIGLSVALVLKPVLTVDNHAEVLAAARGASLQRARELVAACCPRPDVPSQVRKLPERREEPPPSPEPELSFQVRVSSAADDALPVSAGASTHASVAPSPPSAAASTAAPAPRAAQRVEPLSPRRYRVQFTADAELKRKLELARDLLRHAHPDGDFAPVVSRALDLLLDELERRRFGRLKCRSKRPLAAAESAQTRA